MKVVGRAVALETGYYPVSENGVCDTIEPGREFDVYEGHETGTWFSLLTSEAPKKGRKAKADPTGEDIA